MITKRLISLHLEIRNRHLQLDAIKYLIQLLPIVNRNTLYALLRFLSNMAQYSEDSKNPSGKHCIYLLLKLFIKRMKFRIVFLLKGTEYFSKYNNMIDELRSELFFENNDLYHWFKILNTILQNYRASDEPFVKMIRLKTHYTYIPPLSFPKSKATTDGNSAVTLPAA